MPTVNIDKRLYRALEAEAKARGKTVEQLIEEILLEWLGIGTGKEKEIEKRLRQWGYV